VNEGWCLLGTFGASTLGNRTLNHLNPRIRESANPTTQRDAERRTDRARVHTSTKEEKACIHVQSKKEKEKKKEKKFAATMEYVSMEGLRVDGRRATELRALSADLGVLNGADGSATFSMGQTKVMAAVFGPKEVEQRSLMNPEKAIVRCEYAMASFSTGERRRRGKSDRRATEISMVIKNALEQTILLDLMPRTQIDVYIQVLQADGGTRSASINAAFLALADAGIPMRDMVCCCAGGYLDETALLDMNYVEDSGGGPDVVVGLHPSLDKMVLLQSDNRISLETFEEVVSLVGEGCKAIGTFMRDVLHKHTSGLAARLLADE